MVAILAEHDCNQWGGKSKVSAEFSDIRHCSARAPCSERVALPQPAHLLLPRGL